MPLTYTVTTTRDCQMTFDGDGDELKITYHRDYFVKVDGFTLVSEIEPYLVQTAAGIPIVNRTTYTTVGGDIIPYVLCRSKSAKPDKANHSLWVVSTKWDTGKRSDNTEGGNYPTAPPANLTDIAPRVEQTLGEASRVLYIDKSPTPKVILTPTGNHYAQPAIERIPTLTLRITQFEASLTYEQMLFRKFKMNQGGYRSKGTYSWLIEQVEKTQVDVQLSGGVVEAAMATYTVSYSPFLYGWLDDRALVDTHYKDATGLKIPFSDDVHRTSTIGFIKADGTQKLGALLPDRQQFVTQDTVDFYSFLQV